MKVTQATREAIRTAAWQRVLDMDQRGLQFGYAEISAEMSIGMEQATSIVRGWEKAGLIKVVTEASGKGRRLFAVVPEAERPKKPVGRTAEQNMWTAMRGLRTFTPTDLAAHASTDMVACGVEDARSYCQSLLAVGYLKVERKAQPGRSEAIYRLVRNTGPLPPVKKRVTAVIDPNTQATLLIGGEA